MAHPLNAEIADRVREALTESGVRITTLSADTGIKERTLRRRLKGDSDWLASDIARIAKRLEVDPTDLMGG